MGELIRGVEIRPLFFDLGSKIKRKIYLIFFKRKIYQNKHSPNSIIRYSQKFSSAKSTKFSKILHRSDKVIK